MVGLKEVVCIKIVSIHFSHHLKWFKDDNEYRSSFEQHRNQFSLSRRDPLKIPEKELKH